MAGRRKLKKVTVAAVMSTDGPLDLRPNTILNPREKVVGVEVENPNNPDEKIILWRSTRDPLSMLFASGAIDEPQRMAGEHWRECYRLCEIGGLRGNDLTREYVDTSPGFHYEPVGDRQIRASRDLKKASQALGVIGEWLVRRILADGLFPKQVAEIEGDKSERRIRFYSDRFKEALETLAKVWGTDPNARLGVSFTHCS